LRASRSNVVYEPLPLDHPVHAAGRRAPPAADRQAERERHPVGREHRRLHRLPRLGAAVVLVHAAGPRLPVRRARTLDPVGRGRVFSRRRRPEHPPDPADDDDGMHLGAVVVGCDHRAGEGVLHLPARAADRHARRVHVARFPALLPVLGSDARADVLPDRDLGQREPALLGDQVLPVHPRRQRHHAARHPRAVLRLSQRSGQPRGLQLRHHALPEVRVRGEPSVVGVSRVLSRLRHQGADVPVPHLAARRAHRRCASACRSCPRRRASSCR